MRDRGRTIGIITVASLLVLLVPVTLWFLLDSSVAAGMDVPRGTAELMVLLIALLAGIAGFATGRSPRATHLDLIALIVAMSAALGLGVFAVLPPEDLVASMASMTGEKDLLTLAAIFVLSLIPVAVGGALGYARGRLRPTHDR